MSNSKITSFVRTLTILFTSYVVVLIVIIVLL